MNGQHINNNQADRSLLRVAAGAAWHVIHTALETSMCAWCSAAACINTTGYIATEYSGNTGTAFHAAAAGPWCP